MEEVNSVVTESADASVADSTPAEGESVVNEGIGADSTPAVAQNTDDEVPFHNHPRWQEVIKQRNEAREQLEQMQSQFDGLNDYAKLDEYLAHHPELVDKIRSTFAEYQGQSDAPTETGEELDSSERQLKELSNEVHTLKATRVKDTYQREFETLAKDINQAHRPLLEELAEVELYRMNKNPFNAYVPGLVEKSYKLAKKKLDSVLAANTAAYVETKVSDAVPSTTPTGKPVNKVAKLDSARKRVEYITQRLKAGG